MSSSIHLVILILTCSLEKCLSHVSLRYPPARQLDLDFLDSFRTEGDCGMESGTLRTSLTAGSLLNLTWHLGYPHGGGYRLELVSPKQSLAMLLVPAGGKENSWETEQGKFAQSHPVQLPQGVECEDCYLRFQRQATEWGKNYKFRSCADIKLVSEREECSGKGKVEGGRCACDRGREGDQCQYETQCQTDQDCNGPKGQGKCLEVDTSIFPFKQCFCAGGWFGSQCQHQARWEEGQAKQFEKDNFTEEKLGDAVLFWRVAGEEVEVIMTAPTTSWVGLGWRPADATKSCQKFPDQYPQPKGNDFHPMDCMDMVIGVAREGLGRVGDFYTRDRSTPREDTFWGGEDDLASSHAWEEDGQTTIRFVKKLAGGVADHPLQGKLTLIWAFGQEDGFYKPDQLKYHGKSSRGISVLEMPDSLPFSSSLQGFSPVTLGILVSCVLLLLLMGLQIWQNFDKKLGCWTPSSYQSFSPNN
eukprot:GFUD01039233.1.p1 GENE.GFUD01039233.1~~GFUD01039233.1.p1  ORF type:complete len:472 (+),score=185.88 GFUD01039233.1:193-1608(+)